MRGQASVALITRAKTVFRWQSGGSPAVLVTAPGRVNLIGEHTDYNEGFVLPMAIDRGTMIAARSGSRETRVFSEATGEVAVLSLDPEAPRREENWANYVQGVVSLALRAGRNVEPFEAIIVSDVPLGGGLSSSASLEVATATLIEALDGEKFDRTDKAKLCQRAEHEYAGVPCGIMDQFTSVFGRDDHLLLIDCRDLTCRPVVLDDPSVTVLVVDTGVKHELANGEYPARRAECESAATKLGVPSLREISPETLGDGAAKLSEREFRRARHVVGEIERTLRTAEMIAACQWESVGENLYASHASLQNDFEVSCAELDALVEIARGIGVGGGVFGWRMTGGGFGGCTVGLVRSEAAGRILEAMRRGYRERTGLVARGFETRPQRGAQVLESAPK